MVWDIGRKTGRYGGTFGSEYVKMENSEYSFGTYKACIEFKCFVGFMLKNKAQSVLQVEMGRNLNFGHFTGPSSPSKLMEIT